VVLCVLDGSPKRERPFPADQVTSVKVVKKRISEEVANGQAAMGGSLVGSASISGGVISAISAFSFLKAR
jgi:hypothetical protein